MGSKRTNKDNKVFAFESDCFPKNRSLMKGLQEKIEKLGGIVSDSALHCTHLISNFNSQPRLSKDLAIATFRGIYVISPQYMEDSFVAEVFLMEDSYEMSTSNYTFPQGPPRHVADIILNSRKSNGLRD